MCIEQRSIHLVTVCLRAVNKWKEKVLAEKKQQRSLITEYRIFKSISCSQITLCNGQS
jgi:hypothetical protein